MSIETLCRIGLDARGLSLKDRISLQSRVNVMLTNGKSEAEIMAYVESYRREFYLDLSVTEGLGTAFMQNLARAGWILPLIALAVHHAR